jgi:hypothetical protein
MKTSLILKSLALLPAAGYPVVAFAEFLGARIPSAINAETALAVFAVAVIGLTLGADYGRKPARLALATSATPAPVARRTNEHHRLAA